MREIIGVEVRDLIKGHSYSSQKVSLALHLNNVACLPQTFPTPHAPPPCSLGSNYKSGPQILERAQDGGQRISGFGAFSCSSSYLKPSVQGFYQTFSLFTNLMWKLISEAQSLETLPQTFWWKWKFSVQPLLVGRRRRSNLMLLTNSSFKARDAQACVDRALLWYQCKTPSQ